MNAQEIINQSRKIVIKIGSNTLANSNGAINEHFMEKLATQCATLMQSGKQIVLVSSGAQLAGLCAINGWAHKSDIHYRQALCAIGQVELMERWRLAFGKKGFHAAQLLLTKDDFEDDHRALNIRNTLFTLVDENVIPIVNENDSIATDEFFIGDNDNLSALTAVLWSADLLILFSDIDGVYTKDPQIFPDASLIEVVNDINLLLQKIKIGHAGAIGTGGIQTKIEAAKKTTTSGIPMILANGKNENALELLVHGKIKSTLFCADNDALFKIITGKNH